MVAQPASTMEIWNGLDLHAVVWDWGATNCYAPDCPGDLTGDGRVNEADLEVFSEGFGR
jgi:hypothetical protein